MEDEPINQNYLIGCDTIENSPSSIIYRVSSLGENCLSDLSSTTSLTS